MMNVKQNLFTKNTFDSVSPDLKRIRNHYAPYSPSQLIQNNKVKTFDKIKKDQTF